LPRSECDSGEPPAYPSRIKARIVVAFLPGHHIGMVTLGVHTSSDDVTLGVESVSIGRGATRTINKRELATAQEVPAAPSARGDEPPHDIASSIDPAGLGPCPR
jgi:hypothetical protein